MRARTLTTLLCAIGLVAVAPAAADAAALQLNRTCYLTGGVVGLSGSGYAPNTPVTISQNGAQIGTAQADALGSFQGSYAAPDVSEADRQTDISVTATDSAGTAATAGAKVSTFNADFSPSQGNPRTLKVNFKADGFNLLGGEPSTIYLHYVAPGGKHKITKRLGKAQGACGDLSTSKRKLFPFSAKRGTWRLQWDTRKSYKKCTKDSVFLCFVREVKICRVSSSGQCAN
ncbi:MAG: hypothetical protein JHC95_06405 [Solirubrobacteraceae bacterium]|nr:hypothetical protein [Solirubrobacteraceae bacterium]